MVNRQVPAIRRSPPNPTEIPSPRPRGSAAVKVNPPPLPSRPARESTNGSVEEGGAKAPLTRHGNPTRKENGSVSYQQVSSPFLPLPLGGSPLSNLPHQRGEGASSIILLLKQPRRLPTEPIRFDSIPLESSRGVAWCCRARGRCTGARGSCRASSARASSPTSGQSRSPLLAGSCFFLRRWFPWVRD